MGLSSFLSSCRSEISLTGHASSFLLSWLLPTPRYISDSLHSLSNPVVMHFEVVMNIVDYVSSHWKIENISSKH